MSTSKSKNNRPRHATRNEGSPDSFQPPSRHDMLVSAARARGRKASKIPLLAELTSPPNSESLKRACDATAALARQCLGTLAHDNQPADPESIRLIEKCATDCGETLGYLNGGSIHCAAATDACLQVCRDCIKELGDHPSADVQALVKGCRRCLDTARKASA